MCFRGGGCEGGNQDAVDRPTNLKALLFSKPEKNIKKQRS